VAQCKSSEGFSHGSLKTTGGPDERTGSSDLEGTPEDRTRVEPGLPASPGITTPPWQIAD